MGDGQRILIVDDHAMVRQGLRQLLEKHGYSIAGEAVTGEEACAAWRSLIPALVLMDMEMPGIGGLEAMKRILAQDARARVVIYSMYTDAIHATRALQGGARGYIGKAEAPELLLEAVRLVLRGGRYIGHEVARHVTEDRLLGGNDCLQGLSAREFEIFRRLAEGKTLTEIAEQLHISAKSVANIQTRVRQKLDVANSGQLTALAIKQGIIKGI